MPMSSREYLHECATHFLHREHLNGGDTRGGRGGSDGGNSMLFEAKWPWVDKHRRSDQRPPCPRLLARPSGCQLVPPGQDSGPKCAEKVEDEDEKRAR